MEHPKTSEESLKEFLLGIDLEEREAACAYALRALEKEYGFHLSITTCLDTEGKEHYQHYDFDKKSEYKQKKEEFKTLYNLHKTDDNYLKCIPPIHIKHYIDDSKQFTMATSVHAKDRFGMTV